MIDMKKAKIKKLPVKKKTLKIKKNKLNKIKAVCLMSGGLDSAIAAKLLQEQGMEVYGITFVSPFFSKTSRFSEVIAKKIGVDIKIVNIDDKYLDILRNPQHGYGSAFNPCTDCHIFMLKEAKKYAKSIGADIIATGEVLGQRPKSQQMEQLEIVEKESGLKGKLLRPLSANLLPRTEAEKKKWVDIHKFPSISGRSRNEQMNLAKQFHISGFSSPAGGCLLTCQESAAKIRDILENDENASMKDMALIKTGRHFRLDNSKIIVGKNFEDNQKLMKLKSPEDYFFEAEEKIPSPITLLQGEKSEKAIEAAAKLTGYYSDGSGKKIIIKYGKDKLEKKLKPEPMKEEEAEELRITWRKIRKKQAVK